MYSFGRKHLSQEKKCARYKEVHVASVRLLTSMKPMNYVTKHSSHIRSAAYSFMLASHKPTPGLFALALCLLKHSNFWLQHEGGHSQVDLYSTLVHFWSPSPKSAVGGRGWVGGGQILRAMRPSVNYVPIELQDRRKHNKWSSGTYKKINKNLIFFKIFLSRLVLCMKWGKMTAIHTSNLQCNFIHLLA